MRALSYLLSGFIGLVLVIFGGKAEVRGQTVSLDWRIFEVPEYGTRVNYPARIFGPAGEPEKGIGQRFESADGSAVLSVYSSENEAADTPVSYLRKNLRRSVACTRFRRHRVRCFDGAGGGSWRDGSLRESSNLRPCA